VLTLRMFPDPAIDRARRHTLARLGAEQRLTSLNLIRRPKLNQPILDRVANRLPPLSRSLISATNRFDDRNLSRIGRAQGCCQVGSWTSLYLARSKVRCLTATPPACAPTPMALGLNHQMSHFRPCEVY
jgi:hypothetical protein